jgi:uncharacterized protein (TIGR01777 family)
MRLLVTGGTGFIGTRLCRTLAQRGHELYVLTRSPHRRPSQARIQFLAWDTIERQRTIPDVEGVINLAGESIATKRWSPPRKLLIRESRVQTTRRLVGALAVLPKRPAVLVNASAVGYYGARGDEKLVETDPPGSGFLAELCQAWEAEAQRAETLGMRVVRLRIGLVLGVGGGVLAKMVPPFRFFVGGPPGNGCQWASWIHQDDVIGLIEWALTHPGVNGAVNATAPDPVTMRTLCRELGRALHRPSWAPVPAVVLHLLLGEMADLLLTGQRVVPRVALQGGYVFRFPELSPALEACLHQ